MLHRIAGMVSKLLEGDAVVAPFALLQEPHDVTWTEAATAYKVETADIKVVFSCKPLQEGLLALTAKNLEDYVA